MWWDEERGSVCLINQTVLPGRQEIITCTTLERLIRAIANLEVRGAPALGVAGAYGMALAALRSEERDLNAFKEEMQKAAAALKDTRPTAVNLSWGVDQVLSVMQEARSVEEARDRALKRADVVAEEDERICRLLGKYGADLLPDGCTVLTHCNAGGLACRAWGTALGVIKTAVQSGKEIHVIACETRPLFQGARLTAWELARSGIDVTVIVDSAAAFLMRKGSVDLVLVGADRITRDAVFNKIGTYMHAVSAHHHHLPFYVAAPISTFDFRHTEKDIRIEERSREEIACTGGVRIVPEQVRVLNYAFDATPMELVTAIVTEQGLLRPPFDIEKVHTEKHL
ncbi:MAG TPA: S-methyl-5-thioribose-1-phosphate isomerase [Methanomicrobiales archaeon]|nr:S-methyl-5-thioribose-1-phosphate isomerase [Methanomicrobiales archaeon]